MEQFDPIGKKLSIVAKMHRPLFSQIAVVCPDEGTSPSPLNPNRERCVAEGFSLREVLEENPELKDLTVISTRVYLGQLVYQCERK